MAEPIGWDLSETKVQRGVFGAVGSRLLEDVILNGISREDNSEGERCKNEFTHFYNRAKELGL